MSRNSQRDQLNTILNEYIFWQSDDGEPHATLKVDGHEEHFRVDSTAFSNKLAFHAGQRFGTKVGDVEQPATFTRSAIDDAVNVAGARAICSGRVHKARLRVSSNGTAIYLDLGDETRRAVEITAEGWRVVDVPGVPILRHRRTKPLFFPRQKGDANKLLKYLTNLDPDHRRLVMLFILAVLRGEGPFPIAAVSGEHGSGKSVFGRIVRQLIDPCGGNLMPPPRADQDVVAAARSNYMLVFDNLSSMPEDLADTLCRIATGGELGGRKLFTDDDSAAFSACRPIIINGIPDLATRGDVASRSLFVHLSPMEKRRTEAELFREFEADGPEILGGFLTVLSAAMARLPDTKLPSDTNDLRMADFALLGIAAEEPFGWPAGTVVDLLRRNTRDAAALIADIDPVAVAIKTYVHECGSVQGLYVLDLYQKVSKWDRYDREGGWPKTSAKFGEALRRVAPALRQHGMLVEYKRTNRGSTYSIAFADEPNAEGLGSTGRNWLAEVNQKHLRSPEELARRAKKDAETPVEPWEADGEKTPAHSDA